MTHDDERLAEALTRAAADAPGPGSACLDADVVAGLAEGRLPDAERTAALAHAAECAECRGWMASTATAIAEPVRAAAPIRRFPWRSAAAAAVLVAAFAGFALHRAAERNGPPTDERLVAAIEDLRKADPEVFAEFRPLDAAERAAPGPAVERGGLRVTRPRGALRDGRPTFTWDTVPGTTTYRIRVRGEDGRVLLERETDDPEGLAYPADAAPIAPGTAFVVRVTATGGAGESSGSAAARVLTEDEGRRFQRGWDAILEKAPGRMQPILLTQWALRMGVLASATSLIGREHPDGWSPLEQETRRLVLRLGEDQEAPR